MPVLVLGSLNHDLTLHVARHPAEGETLHIHHVSTAPGGKGANQAVAAARAGAATTMIGRVGDDDAGAELLRALDAAGVDWQHVTRSGRTGTAYITVNAEGDNRILIHGGANDDVGKDELAALNSLLLQGDRDGHRVLMLQREVPPAANIEAIKVARKLGNITVVLDPAPAPGQAADVLDLLEDFIWLTPNQTEAAALLGRDIPDRAAAEKAADELMAHNPAGVILKLGGQGAVVRSHATSGFLEPMPVRPVDTVAAGDAFNGYFAAALAEGLPIDDAAERAAIAGALSVTRPGAMDAIPTRSEVEALLD
ncbi:MAG: ribokinase [Planctomycetota bacterium]